MLIPLDGANAVLDRLARYLALDDANKGDRIQMVTELAEAAGIFTASIGPVYRGLATGEVEPLAVPAINLRGLTYDLARAVWRAVAELEAGPVIFELAPSESINGRQGYEEYAALVLAAALREGYSGPVFLQVDHLQVDRPDPQHAAGFRAWCEQSAAAGFRQVDFDASALCEAAPSPADGGLAAQTACAWATAAAAAFHQRLDAGGDAVYGGEVGEIGGANTTVADLHEFMAAYRAAPGSPPPLGKISVNTGTTHGGIVDASGRPGPMPLDLALLAELAGVARRDYGLPGVVQHAASTLSHTQLGLLPRAGVCEVHLATGIQNLVFDHPLFDPALRARMQAELLRPRGEAEGGRGPGDRADETPAQRFYAARWTAWGQFKAELWGLPEDTRAAIRAALTDWCRPVFTALRVAGRAGLLDRLYRETAEGR